MALCVSPLNSHLVQYVYTLFLQLWSTMSATFNYHTPSTQGLSGMRGTLHSVNRYHISLLKYYVLGVMDP